MPDTELDPRSKRGMWTAPGQACSAVTDHLDTRGIRLWIDCDAGVDDAQAILLAASDHSAQILGVSCVFGNVDVAQVTANVCRVLTLCGRADVPVLVGCGRPLVAAPQEPNWWFGRDGLGDAPHARPTPGAVQLRPAPGHAAVRLLECAREHDGQLTVVALGPLTNIAVACTLDPSLPSRLRSLVVMGSAEAVGNVTPTAEFNFHADPEAAAVVMNAYAEAAAAGRPALLRVVSWELCERHPIPWDVLDRWLGKETPRARFLAAVAERSIASSKAGRGGARGWESADPLAMAVALRPSLVTGSRQVRCRVETQGSGMVRGMAVYDWHAQLGGRPNVDLVTTVDLAGVLDMMDHSLM